MVNEKQLLSSKGTAQPILNILRPVTGPFLGRHWRHDHLAYLALAREMLEHHAPASVPDVIL